MRRDKRILIFLLIFVLGIVLVVDVNSSFDSAYGPEITVTLNNLNADTKMVELLFEGLGEVETVTDDHPEQLVVEFSQKPFMSILWFGTIILIIGTLISFTQRIKSISS